MRRLLALTEAGGAKLNDRTRALIEVLPKIDWLQVHSLADEVTGPGSEQRFEQFFALLTDLLGQLIRVRAIGGDDSEQGRLAARMIPVHRLATWAELWETMHARKAETLALNLDRKSFILEIFARMQDAARG